MRLIELLRYSLLGILVYVVFHAPISTFLIDTFGYKEIFKAAKDVLIFGLASLAIYAIYKQGRLKEILTDKVTQLIIGYALISVLVTSLTQPELNAVLAGSIINFRFLAIFLVARVVSLTEKSLVSYRNIAVKAVLYCAMMVVGFGLLQITVLPNDFLANIGYGPDTIKPFDTVDQNSDFIRIISTLRGANPLGAYLLVVALIASSLIIQNFNRFKQSLSASFFKSSWKSLLLSIGSVVVMYFTYSRSAALGLLVGLAALILLADLGKYKKWSINLLAVVVVATSISVVAFQDSDFVNFAFFHSDQESVITDSSNSDRISAYSDGLSEVLENPFGQGVGSAGPASIYDDGANFSENYFIQIAQEVGVFGLQALIIIFYMVAVNLYRQRNNAIPLALFVSFIGINLAGLFMHVWTDETLAITWWILAGLWYQPGRLSTSRT